MAAEAGRSRAWDLAMILLLVSSVALVFWHEALDPAADAGARRVLEWVDLGFVLFFLAEWAWRVRRSGPRAGRYAVRNAWELLGMVPILLPAPAALRALRLFRLVRILRVFGALGRRIGLWQRVAQEGHLHKIALASGLVTVVGSLLVWLTERGANPDLREYPEALWWAVVTVTTVGYGDITPVTATGRIVAGALMVTGIGTIGLLASSLASVLVVQREEAAAAPLPAAAGALAGELRALAALRDAGTLTAEEFTAAKERVLGLRR